MNSFIDQLFQSMLEIFPDARIAVVLIAMLPVVEARLAIPIALKCGLTPLESWFFGFLGSSVAAPLLLLCLLPLLARLSKSKLFAKASGYLLTRFSKKAHSIQSDESPGPEWKKTLGVTGFVALPLPLTGVWTGSAIAAVLKLNYFKALGSVLIGNLIASSIVTLLCIFFSKHINLIILAITIVAALAVCMILIKMFFHKKNTKPL